MPDESSTVKLTKLNCCVALAADSDDDEKYRVVSGRRIRCIVAKFLAIILTGIWTNQKQNSEDVS